MIYVTPEKITANEAQKIADEWTSILDSGQDLFINMANTTYIASAGLRSLLIALKSAKAKGCDFALCNPNSQVQEILRVTGLTKIMPINDDNNINNSRSR